jgi:hypothetical protein
MAIIKQNVNAYESGEVYLARLQNEVNREFGVLFTLLSSYWKSNVDGPNYARNLKAISICLSQIKIALDDVLADNKFSATRTEYLYQVVTNLLFPESAPNLESTDDDFRSFLVSIISVYFKGSTPEAIQEGIELLTSGTVRISEDIQSLSKSAYGYDISNEFTFTVDIYLNEESGVNTILSDHNIRILLSVIKPAHTLYRLKYILRDEYEGNRTTFEVGSPFEPNKVLDKPIVSTDQYRYADFRRFSLGVFGIDPFGAKQNHAVVDELHVAP